MCIISIVSCSMFEDRLNNRFSRVSSLVGGIRRENVLGSRCTRVWSGRLYVDSNGGGGGGGEVPRTRCRRV